MLKSIVVAGFGLFILASVPSCASDDAPRQGEEQVGSARLPLQATGPSGAVYRLQSAVIDFAGPTMTSAFADSSESTLVAELPVGSYSVSLREGWQMIRASDLREMDAELASPNPVAAEILDGVVTDVTFVFDVGREKIAFGNGQASVSIVVNETGDCDLDDHAPPSGCTVDDAVACVCEGCNDDGVCGSDEDCVCDDCAAATFCASCNNDGICSPWIEGCSCADCAGVAECAPFVCNLMSGVPSGGCPAPDATACVCTGCNTDGTCGNDDDCTCPDCAGATVCGCNGDGSCSPWTEGCGCADCNDHPACN